MAEITITIRADEDDLRRYAAHGGNTADAVQWRLRNVIIAALPKPRIVVTPGMVLRRVTGQRAFGVLANPIVGQRQPAIVTEREGNVPKFFPDGLDPDVWTVILAAEDPS